MFSHTPCILSIERVLPASWLLLQSPEFLSYNLRRNAILPHSELSLLTLSSTHLCKTWILSFQPIFLPTFSHHLGAFSVYTDNSHSILASGLLDLLNSNNQLSPLSSLGLWPQDLDLAITCQCPISENIIQDWGQLVSLTLPYPRVTSFMPMNVS